MEGRHITRAKVQVHDAIKEGLGLFHGEEKLWAADLDQLVARSQTAQGQRRIGSGHHDQVNLLRKVHQEESDRVVNRLGLNQVVIVQDDDQVAGQVAQIVQQRGEDRPGRRRLRGPEHRQGRGAHALPCAVKGRDQVSKESGQVVVFLAHREPGGGGGLRGPGKPLSDQRSLPEANGGGDQGQPPVKDGV